MEQRVSVITLGIDDLARSRRFYVDGFGWQPVFENDDIVFYQMNGFVLGTWLRRELETDMGRSLPQPGAFSLAHNVRERDEVQPALARLAQHGGQLLKPAAETFYGGFAGYIADPDGHGWEIAWNPHWPISAQGNVRFSL